PRRRTCRATAARFCPSRPGRDWVRPSRQVLATGPGIGTQQAYDFSCPDLFPRGHRRSQVRGGPVRPPNAPPRRLVPQNGTFFAARRWATILLVCLIRGGFSVSMSQAVARHVPYLRRYARALTGSQNAGDAYVAATLEALIEDPAVLSGGMSLRVALYRTFSRIWTSVPVNA